MLAPAAMRPPPPRQVVGVLLRPVSFSPGLCLSRPTPLYKVRAAAPAPT